MSLPETVATLPPSEDADYWVELGRWGVEHAGPEGIPFEDYGTYYADWSAQCHVCNADVFTEVPLPFHPKWVGWTKPGDGGLGRTWCRTCGASAWATLVRIRKVATPALVDGLDEGPSPL